MKRLIVGLVLLLVVPIALLNPVGREAFNEDIVSQRKRISQGAGDPDGNQLWFADPRDQG